MNRIDGMEQLDTNIQSLLRDLDGAAIEQAVAAAGDVIFKEVEMMAPVKTGNLKASLRNGHYKSPGSKKRQYTATITVPNSKRFGIMHYGVFLEYGTSKMAAQPFMRPAFEASKDQAVQAFSDEIEKALR